ncbi:MAG: TatD family hydrolase [Bacteroidota bacterium]
MFLTDSHTHLYLETFDDDRDQVIEKAINTGIQRFFLPNIESSTIDSMLDLVNTYPDNCFPMIGLHPCSVNENFEGELKIVEQLLLKRKFYAIGEIGIDLYWDKTFFEQQKIAFRRQIELAKKNNLPIVVHSRNSFNEIFNIIDELNDETLTGIFHCFSGTVEQAKKVINYGGFKLGIGGVLTFKNSGLDKVVEQIDLQHIVLETDSPYLAPVPHRGKRNEPAYILQIAQKVANLHNISLEKVAEITTQNSRMVFKI